MMMAMDQNRLIGKAGGLPWHIPGELAYFKATTMGKPVLMGRKTHESIGRPLPGRTNIVVTRNVNWSADGVQVCHSLSEALSCARSDVDQTTTGADEMVIIGGAALCREAMPLTERLYLTVIEHSFAGDVYLDSYRPADWREVSRRVRTPEDTGGYTVNYLVLERHPM